MEGFRGWVLIGVVGFIPTTGLSRNVDLVVPAEIMKDAKTISEGSYYSRTSIQNIIHVLKCVRRRPINPRRFHAR